MIWVLVCGGRDYSDRDSVYRELDELRADHKHVAVIEGGSTGADTFAREWCAARNQKCITVNADWEKHGKKAGPIRNQRMLNFYHPQLVVAFPGGAGTADMVRRAAETEVPVRKIGWT